MRLFVVRHVKAGERSRWRGADERRPASKNGHRQAIALADRLEADGVSALISSPALRCVQTVEPLADRLGLKIEIDERLAEGSPFEHALAVVRDAPDRALLCSHGDVITDLIEAMTRRGMELTTAPDWRKATLWVLDGDAADREASGGERLFSHAAVEAPPAVDDSR
jgi:phosphohistidine phosphatase SixA